MIQGLRPAGPAEGIRRVCVDAFKKPARHDRRPLDQLAGQQVRHFFVHLAQGSPLVRRTVRVQWYTLMLFCNKTPGRGRSCLHLL
jgi:hypothetical protein